MACAIEAQRQNLSYTMLDKGSLVNSIRHYPTNSTFFSTAELLELDGLPFPTTTPGKRPTRAEALEYYLAVARKYDLNVQPFTPVNDVEQTESGFTVHTSKGPYQARFVVAATGYYDRPNYLNVPGEALPHVSHYYDEAYPYVGMDVAVVGGSNSAAENTLDLYQHGVNVKLVHHGEALKKSVKYWLKPNLENRIKEGSIPAYFNTQVKAIHEGKLELVEQNNETFFIPADQVFLMTGYHPDANFLRKLGVEIDDSTLKPAYNPDTYESNLPGLYLAGVVLAGHNTSEIFIENGRFHGAPIVADILKKTKDKAPV
jgi:thioredoxin reductase (NADPH)